MARVPEDKTPPRREESEPASLELADAIRWYEERRPGWGAKLFDAVVHAFELIERHPEIGSLRGSRPAAPPNSLSADFRTLLCSEYDLTMSMSSPSHIRADAQVTGKSDMILSEEQRAPGPQKAQGSTALCFELEPCALPSHQADRALVA